MSKTKFKVVRGSHSQNGKIYRANSKHNVFESEIDMIEKHGPKFEYANPDTKVSEGIPVGDADALEKANQEKEEKKAVQQGKKKLNLGKLTREKLVETAQSLDIEISVDDEITKAELIELIEEAQSE